MFIASKLLSFATQPLAWVIALLALGLVGLARWPRAAKALLASSLALLVLIGWQPLPDLLLRNLETQNVALDGSLDLAPYAGVVVLGGALEASHLWQVDATRGRPGLGQIALNDAGERMMAAVILAQRFPNLRLLFTGGEGEWQAQAMTEADRAKLFFDAFGLPQERVLYESRSRTTYENAIESARLPGVAITKPWLLLTSASHMPRSIATFRKAGWNVTAYPVDFRTSEEVQWSRYALGLSAVRWQLALHEHIGILAYRLAGRL